MSDSIIGTKNVWPNYSATNIKNASTGNKSSLGKDDFLKILIAQMQNQDPTQPLQDKEFIAQMAQFTSVEQLTNMSSEMKLLRQSLGAASGLIGKNIGYSMTDSNGKAVVGTGLVDSIVMKSGEQYAKVGTLEIPMDKITSISNKEGS